MFLPGTKPFTLPLVEMSHFQHSKKSCTLWLDPGQDSPLQHLSDALVAAFPHCTDLRSDPKRGIARFAPHLSLGGFAGMDALDDAKRDIEAQDYWSEKQEEFEVKSVFMISRMGYDDPFKVRFEIPLGFGAGSEREINLSYVAAPGAQEEGLEERFKKMPRPGSKEHQAWNLKGKPWGLFEQTERVLSRTS